MNVAQVENRGNPTATCVSMQHCDAAAKIKPARYRRDAHHEAWWKKKLMVFVELQYELDETGDGLCGNCSEAEG